MPDMLIKHYLILMLLLTACKENKTPAITVTQATDSVSSEGTCYFEKTEKKLHATEPFSSATRIEIVSYPVRYDSYTNDTLISNGVFNVQNVSERIILNQRQIHKLFSILHNFKMRGKTYASLLSDCYNPKHSIVFYKDDTAIAFYEICLECGGVRSSKSFDMGDYCQEKKCWLQKFFKSAGIRNFIINEYCMSN